MKGTLCAALISVLAFLTACNDSSDPEIGRFIDAAVAGINYETPSRSGSTNANGEFFFEPGENITFSIGGIRLPTIAAAAILTPLNLFNASHPFDTAVVNLSRLLLTLDTDGDPSNGITVDAATHTAAADLSVTDFHDTATFETEVAPLVGAGLVSASQAATHVQNSLKALNGHASLTLIGRYADNQALAQGIAEIVAFHNASHSIMVINAMDATVDILDASGLTSTALANPLSASNLTRRAQINVGNDVTSITSGGINSVAISGDLMAVAVENANKQANGVIAFYTLDGSGNATFHKEVPAGALPDSVAFTPNGAFLLAANEGEPSGDYTNDPEGSVTIIPITNGVAADTGTQVGFTDFNSGGSRAGELGANVRISHPNATVAQDLEPEFVTSSADSTIAYVSMQENNALAVIDIANGTVISIFGLGFKDHSVAGNGLDPSDRDDAININTFSNLRGLYMPDAVASFSQGGGQYVLTANEGDVREYFFDVVDEAACNAAGGLDFDDDDGCLSWIDATRVDDLTLDATAFPNASTLQEDDRLGRLNALTTQGDSDGDGDGDTDTIFSFGGRSFSIWNGDTGALVFDSGDDFEQITAVALGTDGFNTTDDANAFDNRSDDKGPEPEALAIGQVGDKRYAFIGLERAGGIMVYEITDPAAPIFVEYTTNRDYMVDIENNLAAAGDLAPEGMQFVSAENSPTGNALLIVGYEVSGTVAIYEFK